MICTIFENSPENRNQLIYIRGSTSIQGLESDAKRYKAQGDDQQGRFVHRPLSNRRTYRYLPFLHPFITLPPLFLLSFFIPLFYSSFHSVCSPYRVEESELLIFLFSVKQAVHSLGVGSSKVLTHFSFLVGYIYSPIYRLWIVESKSITPSSLRSITTSFPLPPTSCSPSL
ncbi:hypothetical protein K435DRAFT_55460 [Dendrothele bispora CBS 962.96]|uniref:Uncharacterized protein n=1 Tax=Dendrothele bispora (strain CBS 962.96) TaxID=1314807 RepID=A0A4S8KRU6_DENBC|nr:hypothetical protein K435DRAFT_55460 [Dendrothele bispora CBS 962.96]